MIVKNFSAISKFRNDTYTTVLLFSLCHPLFMFDK